MHPSLSKYFSVNSLGHLSLNGIDLVALAKESQRPVYVMNETEIRCHAKEYRDSLASFYPKSSDIFYASKAFLNRSLARLLREEGVLLDVCSLGELFIAEAAGVSGEALLMHGNNKSIEELRAAVEARVKRIVVDNPWEFLLLERICQEKNCSADILIRVNPCVAVETQKCIATGEKGSKFGMSLEAAETFEFFQKAAQHPQIRLKGLHYHIGSALLGLESYHHALKAVVGFIDRLSASSIVLEELDIGGGLGVEYHYQKPPLSIPNFLKGLCDLVLTEMRNRPLPHLMLEPGRSLLGRANCTLYTIGAIKKEGNQLYAAVNGGMSDLLRPYLYKASYSAVVANKMEKPVHSIPYKIVGNCCESGDVLIDSIFLPQCAPGDTLAVFSTSAYGYVMANTYNQYTLPGVVLVRENAWDWIMRPQPLEDLLRYDCIPKHLQ